MVIAESDATAARRAVRRSPTRRATARRASPGRCCAFRVLGEAAAEGRFEALHARRARPAGRPRAGARAPARALAAGQGRRGPGRRCCRARPASASRASCARCASGSRDEPHTRLALFCSPYHANSALWPGDRAARAGGRASCVTIRAERSSTSSRRCSAQRRGRRRGARRCSPTCSGSGRRPLPALELSAASSRRRGPCSAARPARWALATRRPVLMRHRGRALDRSDTLELLEPAGRAGPAPAGAAGRHLRPEFTPPWRATRMSPRSRSTGSGRPASRALIDGGRRQGAPADRARSRSSPAPTACRCSSRS